MASDLYKLLEVSPDADATLVKSAYRRLAGLCHPDKTGHLPEKERLKRAEKFKEVALAYAILGNEERRAAYDRARARRATGIEGLFGDEFEELVNRVKTEGVSSANLDDLIEELVGAATKVRERAPAHAENLGAKLKGQRPSDFLAMVEEMFGLDPEGGSIVEGDEKKGKRR